jgi:hypothetical protein
MKNNLTIDDLLRALHNPNKDKKTLKNTRETWERIGRKDSFDELGLESSELEDFLNDWISSNEYSNI